LRVKKQGESEKDMQITKTKWMAIGVAIILAASFLTVFFFLNSENTEEISYPIRVACVGDSITNGTYYPADLQALLGENFTVGNFGVGAATVLLETEKPYMNQTAFQNAKDFQPNIVIIMLGTNDARPDHYAHIGEFTTDYRKLISEFRALGKRKPEIWLVKPPPIFNNSLGPTSANLIYGVMPRIDQVAVELHLHVIDVYSALTDHAEYFPFDGIHPDSEGARIIANVIYLALIRTSFFFS
jgi:lysophospholipase L1-like esterase